MNFQFHSNSLEQWDLARYTQDLLRVNLRLQYRVDWSFKMSIVGWFPTKYASIQFSIFINIYK